MLSQEYAIKIARDWNVRECEGATSRFPIRRAHFGRFDVRLAGNRAHAEYWIPAEDLPALNEAIVGEIAVVQEFR